MLEIHLLSDQNIFVIKILDSLKCTDIFIEVQLKICKSKNKYSMTCQSLFFGEK